MAIAEPHVGIIDGTAGATIEALGELDDERVLTPIEEAYRVSPMDVGGSCVGAWGRIALRNRNPVVDGPPRTGHPLEVTSVGRARAEAWLHEALANPYEVTRAEAADWIQMVVRADIDYAEDLVEFGTDAEQPPEQE